MWNTHLQHSPKPYRTLPLLHVAVATGIVASRGVAEGSRADCCVQARLPPSPARTAAALHRSLRRAPPREPRGAGVVATSSRAPPWEPRAVVCHELCARVPPREPHAATCGGAARELPLRRGAAKELHVARPCLSPQARSLICNVGAQRPTLDRWRSNLAGQAVNGGEAPPMVDWSKEKGINQASG
jgi:hypothetical protein